MHPGSQIRLDKKGVIIIIQHAVLIDKKNEKRDSLEPES
jgi:hypothetical protein